MNGVTCLDDENNAKVDNATPPQSYRCPCVRTWKSTPPASSALRSWSAAEIVLKAPLSVLPCLSVSKILLNRDGRTPREWLPSSRNNNTRKRACDIISTRAFFQLHLGDATTTKTMTTEKWANLCPRMGTVFIRRYIKPRDMGDCQWPKDIGFLHFMKVINQIRFSILMLCARFPYFHACNPIAVHTWYWIEFFE